MLIFVMLAGFACNMPALSTRKPEPGPLQFTATLAPTWPVAAEKTIQPTARPAFLPPGLVEVQPLAHSELQPTIEPVFYFNQSMDRASVESAFEFQPQLSVRYEWLDDSTLRLVPAQPVSLQSDLVLTIQSSARAANGLGLPEAIRVDYQAPQKMRVVERLPKPGGVDIDPSSAVVATFNRPVVALGADPAAVSPAFSIEPESGVSQPGGRGEWLNTSTYIFYPEPAFFGGALYTIRLNPSLTAYDGSPLSEDQASQGWSFTTSSPAVLSLEPATDQPIRLDAAFTLAFNQAMDKGSVEANFSLARGDGSKIPGAFSWDEPGMKVTYTPENLLDRGMQVSVVVFGAALSQGGAALGQDFAATWITTAQFGVAQTIPAAGEALEAYYGYSSLEVRFTSPVAAGQDLSRLFEITPPISGQSVMRSLDGYQVYVSGYFAPSASYTLTVSPALSDRWGASLELPYSLTFSTSPARPSLVIHAFQAAGQSVFVPAGETSLAALSTNIERLSLSRGSLSLNEFIQAQQDYQGLQNWEPLVKASWIRPLHTDRNASATVEIPLQESGEPLEPGLYFLKVDTQPVLGNSMNAFPMLVVVSPIQMTFKTSLHQAFIWAVRVASQEPETGAKVTVYDQYARPVANCETDAVGTCQAELPTPEVADPSYYAVIGQPGDDHFSLAADDWSQGVSPWDSDMPYQKESPDPDVYLYTDRPIYRPGQAVNFKAVVRNYDNGCYLLSNLKELTVDVVSPYDPTTNQALALATLHLGLNSYGSGAGAYSIPQNARTGTYTLRIHEVPYKEIYFTVAEYRKPEIDLQVKFNQPDVLVGKDIQAEVKASYFFGAPAGNVAVRWSLFGDVEYPSLPDGMNTGVIDTSWMEPWAVFGQASASLGEGQAITAADGSLAIKISGEMVRDHLEGQPRNMLRLTLEVTAVDESGLPVSARDQMNLHPYPYYIGIRPEKWMISAGEEITYSLLTVGWQGERVAHHPLAARFSRVSWIQQDSPDPNVAPEYKMSTTDAGSVEFTTSEDGEARLAFVPGEPGTYMIEVTGEEGETTQVLTWVRGPGFASWPGLPNQRLMLQADMQQYIAGESARIFIPNPFEGEALALITVERGRVMRSLVIKISGSGYELTLPLTDEDAPNIFVSTTLLGRNGVRPDFRVGYIKLGVDPAAYLLKVEIQASPDQPQPGEEVILDIHVTDYNGNAVKGEFSLALVDKAVLALAAPNSPSVEEAFYGEQYLGVMSSYSLATYAGRSLYLPPGRGGGGAGEEMASAVPLRDHFEDTAFWSGQIETDASGTARVTVRLPENLTTWRADVRGLTADTLVGSAQLDLVTSKPLLIRPVVPNFVILDDHIELAAVVQNNTQDSLQASVRLEGAGFILDDPNSAVQPVALQPGERQRVGWWGTVRGVEALDLAFSVKAGELSDATRPEGGALPVARYTVLQTFGTSGMLSGAETRQELVSLPRSFTPVDGDLQVELSPSLAAVALDGIRAQEKFPLDGNEAVFSRLLPNLAAYTALRDFKVEDEMLLDQLRNTVADSVNQLVIQQNNDGGWGWVKGAQSSYYLSNAIFFGLYQASQAGVFVDPQILEKGRAFLEANLVSASARIEDWELDQLALGYFVLQQSGGVQPDFDSLYALRDRLSPWGKAFLALALDGAAPGEARARTLLNDLQSSASRSATGAHWEDSNPGWHSWSSLNFTTAVVVYALARLDPASQVLPDATRYLIVNRHPQGGWNSSYESAWTILALVETARRTGDLQTSFSFSASLNGAPLMSGQVDGPTAVTQPVASVLPLSRLQPESPNVLQIERREGSGWLYYRAFLSVSRPAQDAQVVSRGITLARQYFRGGQDCRKEVCSPVTEASLDDPQPLLARLTVTTPEDMHYLVIEDHIPAGVEILNLNLQTTQQNFSLYEQPVRTENNPAPYVVDDPFRRGWGWWLFQNPQVYTDRIRWIVDFLPAGTYELVYRVTPFLAGEFQLIPAHAYQIYFPEVEGYSSGGVLTIQ
jgi:uncharacterized protein YfaS (alpha-2-macroglobulin family)